MSKDKEQQFLNRMAALIGTVEAGQLLAVIKNPVPRSVRYNSRQCALKTLKGEVVPWNEPYGRYWHDNTLPSRTLDYAAGKYYIQEASAMLAISAAAKVIDFSDKIVLDLTAAPGGKATQVAELITNGYLLANEVIKKRLTALTWNINRHRLNNVITTSMPADRLAAALPGFFDVVIVDAPCSGEGLFRKGKHSLAGWSEKNVLFCARRQKAILREAVKLMRPGGYLVYSTCTFAKEENEDQVEYLLNRGFSPVPWPDGLRVSPAITGNKEIALCSRRIFPHREGGAGAFVSFLRKRGRNALEFSLGYELGKSRKIVTKKASPICSGSGLQGFFYEKRGIISNFPYDKIPFILYREALQIGAPIMNKLKDNELMFGSVQIPDSGAVVTVTRQEAESYISGKEIRLNLTDGYYFVSFAGDILAPVKVTGGRTINKFPKALIRI